MRQDEMRQGERGALDAALRRARSAAYPSGGFVGQESFMGAEEILELADRAGIGQGTRVLDLCCGLGGPGRLVAAATGCAYLGVDASPSAVRLARDLAGDLPCRFRAARVPPVPGGPFEVVLLLETMLAFADKRELLRGIAAVLSPRGRLGLTVETGAPLTEEEQVAMPDADTVWPVPVADLERILLSSGFALRWSRDLTRAHQQRAAALTAAFLDDRTAIAAAVGERTVDELVRAHRLWSTWLGDGRVRKLAVVAELVGTAGEPVR